MELSDVRKRVRQTIDRSRHESAARRARVDEAAAVYQRWLEEVAVPLGRQIATALKAEGQPFQVFTPGGGLRLSSDRAAEDFLELVLDLSGDEPLVLGRISRVRGSRVLTVERPVREGVAVGDLTETDLLEFFLQELRPFLER